MEGQEAPPPQPQPPPLLPPPLQQFPPQNPPYLFSPTVLLPSSSSFHPQMNNIDQLQALPDIDWVSLLSGQTGVFGENIRPENGVVVEEQGLNSNDNKKKGTRSRKASRPRFAFQTRSADDILDDGYRWRKYGQKAVKNSKYPRSYYRCTHHSCNVKKQVQRLSKDTSIVVTTYEGIHNHPCEKLMETLTPLLKQMQFLARF